MAGGVTVGVQGRGAPPVYTRARARTHTHKPHYACYGCSEEGVPEEGREMAGVGRSAGKRRLLVILFLPPVRCGT
jgi:hypothetical protein